MRRLIEALRSPSPKLTLRLAIANLVANIGIVLTGGAVRLTASGLGCPEWPRCTEDSFTPHSQLGFHGVIEFGNRLLTYVLVAIAVATWLAVWRSHPIRRMNRVLATVIACGIPFQGVIGGITVLTDLNPWVVALHLMLSMVLIALATALVYRLRDAPVRGRPLPRIVWGLVLATYAALWTAVYVGTIVTGSGPHAGDIDSPRNGLDPAQLSRVHADVVLVLIGLTIACVIAFRYVGVAMRPALVLLGLELAQAVIGFVQYYTDLPILLVGTHLLGAALLLASGTWLLVSSQQQRRATDAPTTAEQPISP